MFGRINRNTAASGHREALRELLLEGVDEMPGCMAYRVSDDSADASTLWATESWDSERSQEVSLGLPAVIRAVEKAMPIIAPLIALQQRVWLAAMGSVRDWRTQSGDAVIHSGGCLCGAVRYSFAGPPIATSLCYCTSCRRATGGPSVAWVVCDEATTEITHGEISVFSSSPGVERGFCKLCGASLTYRRDSRPGLLDFTAASLDEPDLFAPTKEIWLSERIPWEAANPRLTGHLRSSKVPDELQHCG